MLEFLNQESNYPVTLEDLLRLTVEKKGSDLHLVVGMEPCIRIDGDIVKQDYPRMMPADVEAMLMKVLTPRDRQRLLTDMELDISLDGYEGYKLVNHIELYNDSLEATNEKNCESVFPTEREISANAPISLKKHSWNMLTFKK